MKTQRGQLLIVVAIVISLGLLMLAVAVDGGRLFLERNRMERGAQSAADAGVGVAAEEMVELAQARRDEALQEWEDAQEEQDGENGPEEEPEFEPCDPEPYCWLVEEDWETLDSEPVRADVEREALEYARANGFDRGDSQTLKLEIEYEVFRSEETLQVRVTIQRRTTILLVGLLGESFVNLEAEGLSKLLGR